MADAVLKQNEWVCDPGVVYEEGSKLEDWLRCTHRLKIGTILVEQTILKPNSRIHLELRVEVGKCEGAKSWTVTVNDGFGDTLENGSAGVDTRQ